MITSILFILLFISLLLGIPIAVSLGLATSITMLAFTDIPALVIAQKMFTSIDKFALMAIPLFVLAGNFLSQGGAAERIIRFAKALVGHLPGGLPMSAIFACIIFAAVSGSSPATVAAIGSIMIGAIQDAGYSPKFSVGSIVTAGSLGILIPPSIVLIVYGVTVDQSIGKLFMAGFIPGIFLGTMLMVVTYISARRAGFKKEKRASNKEIFTAFKESVWALLVIVIVIGGIYGGIFTPTEAAAVSAVYGFVVVKFIYKDLKWADVPKIIMHSAATSAMILFIIANAMLFAYFLTVQQIPQALAQWIIDMNFSKVVFLIFVNILLLIGGNFMEPSSLIMILAPLIFPAAMKLGIDPIHLGIIITVNMEIGMLTPPVGLNLFVASGISGMSLQEVIRASMPWFFALLLGLLIITYIPQISLFLPNLIYKF
ncbi:TRAP transporter large permease subunit [Deferribacterales bacterium Es71-Z0220]|jgi:C4-dicarboxylate transporter DctM subunit|uniref:TRAP transporter large permease n=1 Tax=Deferrivibrio essentukiensis TaxID=2880922 RepID=UPI001F604A41|nr:TRAP transporter large permease subunit [Deferrivibrio essentukiensis]MBZ4672586.1 C4-dicarboxylate transporter, large subunit [Deferribacteraceae bacterium]MCB4204102.1 TRAP transporter large permease subunit [Deferrivibrio essentukiensis]